VADGAASHEPEGVIGQGRRRHRRDHVHRRHERPDLLGGEASRQGRARPREATPTATDKTALGLTTSQNIIPDDSDYSAGSLGFPAHSTSLNKISLEQKRRRTLKGMTTWPLLLGSPVVASSHQNSAPNPQHYEHERSHLSDLHSPSFLRPVSTRP
jgi:hypothetical protein